MGEESALRNGRCDGGKLGLKMCDHLPPAYQH